jgi:ComF family protein
MSEQTTPPAIRRSNIRKLLEACADLIMPPCCLICHSALGAHHMLCAPCWRDVHFIRHPLCDVTGIPLPFDTGERMISAAAAANPPAYDRARAVAHFSGSMRTLVHRFKYADRQDARALFGQWLFDASRELRAEADIIVPVPLNRLRLLSRRFNQAAILAKTLSKLSKLPMDPSVLRRMRSTASQVGLSQAQRRRNVAGAFGVPRNRRASVSGKRVLLVDDVITTGATAAACARALKRAGAIRVDVVALAIATHETSVAA